MFCDSCYYVTENTGDRRQVILISNCNLVEFVEMFLANFDRMPFIMSMVQISEEEFEALKESIKFSTTQIFEGNGKDYE